VYIGEINQMNNYQPPQNQLGQNTMPQYQQQTQPSLNKIPNYQAQNIIPPNNIPHTHFLTEVALLACGF
jgi:hypothetical protein